MVIRNKYIPLIFLLLLIGSLVNETLAAKVTYHILTLPIDSTSRYNYHMRETVHGHRLEAFKIVVDKQTTVELPAAYKSPLVTPGSFKYYNPEDITIGAAAIKLFDSSNNPNKGILYDIKAGSEAKNVAEGTTIDGNTAEYYVVYEYNISNTIAQLDGSVRYNIRTKYKDKNTIKDKGFLALNRGRNNRPALLPTANVDPEMLASEDFVVAPVTGTGIGTYWQSGDNKNKKEITSSKFFFMFKFEGLDPYNIIIRTAYARDTTYIEKNDNSNPAEFVYKYYKEGSLFANSTNNAYIASDEHIHYNYTYDSSLPDNPTNLVSGTSGTHTGYDARNGYYHGQTGTMWNSFAILNNTTNDGYVLMGTRTVDANGKIPDSPYYLKEKENRNNLYFNAGNSTDNLSIEGIYPIKKVTFKVPTPFYQVTASTDHIISVSDWVSQYTVDNDPIDTKYLPAELRRKYCSFNGKFYKDAARTKEITMFSDADYDNTEGYKVYIGYDVSASIPFKAITPAVAYDATTWAGATWYELTDEASTQIDGMKLKYDGSANFKNDGADGEYAKTSEFAFIGDPYELQVIYRNTTSGATPYFVGATGTPPTTGTALTINTSATEGYKWELPYDPPTNSFLLRKYKGEGNWYWEVTRPTPVAISYSTKEHIYNVTTANAQAVTFNVSNLTYTENYYITVTAGGTNSDQVSVPTGKIYVEAGGTASFTAAIKARGDVDKEFTLSIQEYNASDVAQGTASVISVNQNSASISSHTVQYSTASSTRLKVMELPEFTYIFNMVDNEGNIAVKGTATQTIFSPLTKGSIPTAIFSPFLADEDVTFYYTFTEGNRGNLDSPITQAPVTNNANIYVSYTTSHLTGKSIQLNNEQQFNVQLNGEYIYFDATSSKILSTPAVGTGDLANYYSWRLEGRDPYSMKIYNVGKSQYVKVDGGTWDNDKTLVFVGSDGVYGDASRFIAMLGNYTGIYEVLAATGSTDYYHIGRPSTTTAETKIYSNAIYLHGADELRFELAGKQPIRYHLIDKSGNELFKDEILSYNPRLVLPADYISPLVDTYYYYPTKAKADAGTGNITELADDTNEDGTQTDGKGDYVVYVKYTVNDLIGFNNTGRINDHPYLLRFLEPYADGYYLEDGKDGLMTEKLKAIYPYCNGDGNLNIYGERMRDEQMGGGSSTRPRWVWFFESATNDPYHVRIHSRSTISYNDVSHPTYLQTYAVHFNQDTGENAKKQRVVTGGALPGVASDAPTEYMILGLAGAYKLMTTQKIGADEDGDGNTTVSETKRREVRSLEQYWKTYNMVKLNVLGVLATTDSYSTDVSTWVVPTTGDYRTTLASRQPNWHSYDVYANATRWNGYNDKEGGHEMKCVEKLEHWFQTFYMGNGTFDVETADIPPVLVLLDRHGWEIMRKPLPVTSYPLGDDELTALRAYDSPMVDKYYFYSNATKASGCHKYTLRMQDGKERDQITVNGVRYSSSSLGDLPPANAKGVKSSGVLNDQFVIYTVKEEYEKSYTYSFTDNGDGTYSESGTASKYLMLQNGRFARDNEGTGDRISYLSKPIHEASNPTGGNVYDMIMNPQTLTVSNVSTAVDDGNGKIANKNLWYLKPNLNIDKEMGIKWAASSGGTGEPLTEYETKKAYKNKTGFDPYNIQLQNAGNDKYLTAHMTSTRLENGIMIGDYSGDGGSDGITFADWINVKESDTNNPRIISGVTVDVGYDHTNLKVTNQTFMAVSDENGNMQLMPRFDHTKRLNVTTGSSSTTTLQDPVNHTLASADDNSSMGPQTTFFVRPQRFHYHIIDNDGKEALRYKRAGDSYPDITNHFRSPLATEFKFYKGLTPTDGVYTEISTGADISANEITGSLAAAGYTADDCDVFVRYSYDESADHDADQILLGQWFTVKLNDLDLQSIGSIVTDIGATQGTGVDLYAGEDARSLTAEDDTEYATKINALSQIGDYYFRIGTSDYTYKKVSVTTVPIDDASDYTETSNDGTFDVKWSNSKPLTVDGDDAARKWQWKFLAAPNEPKLSDGTPNPIYTAPDPYSVKIYNRKANCSSGLSEPNPMGIAIKVPNESTGANRFALLSHPSGGYALVVAKTYEDYSYLFLNGTSMTVPTTTAAGTASETSFNYKNGILSPESQVLLNNDVTYHYVYQVITNKKMVEEVNQGNKLAATAEQTNEEATSHSFAPYLPESIQSPLLNMDDYKYYGSVTISGSTYTVAEPTKLHTLYGLYDDVVYVRYDAYDPDKTQFKVPNEKGTDGVHVIRGSRSNDVSMNINGGLPYNIIWYNDNMMKAVDTSEPVDGDYDEIHNGGSLSLSGTKDYVWYFTENDPYALKIKHKDGKYLNGTATLSNEAGAMQFMLLKKTGYDYGVLQVMGTTGVNVGKKLTGFGGALTENASTDPEHFIIFGLSVHDLIYRLIINKTNQHTIITWRDGDENTYLDTSVISATDTLMIKGTTQRNLTSKKDDDEENSEGSKYQLGTTLSWGGNSHIYSHDAGMVSIGDDLQVPNVFYRPNCTFDFYIEGVYNSAGTSPETELNNRFKGLKLKKLMSASELIDKTVVVNIVYKFNETLATNAGLGFVTSTGQNLWYTFETSSGTTPYLAHYTNALGLQSVAGRDTRYTNDYLWTPLGDPYGFKMYNRYMLKNSGGTNNVMTMNNIAEDKNLFMAVPGTTLRPAGEDGAGTAIPEDYGIFELITGDADGYFRVHPIANTGATKYYVRRGDLDYAVLSTTPTDWTFGLDMTLLQPYYQRAGYVGGLNATGKTAYENVIKEENWKITDLQKIVYSDTNIVPYSPGYYRLHNQPGVSGISPVRYASGYLHETEKAAVSGGIPMHFYSRAGVTTTFEGDDGLGSGFTVTPATRGEIPVPSMEYDPSSIFYFSGNGTDKDSYNNPISKMQTQGLYVSANPNGDDNNGTTTSKLQRAVMSENIENAITFSVMDIGGAVLLIHDGADPTLRRYLNYDQINASDIYDLKYYHNAPTDDAKWCMVPADSLMVKTNNGGDGYYYATFCAPFDVKLPDNIVKEEITTKDYYAYVCDKWDNNYLHPTKVPAVTGTPSYNAGKFVPAGTPVIIRVKDESGSLKLTLPSTSPSSSLSCVFTGSYLEMLLSAANPVRDVYTFGLPMTSDVSKDNNYVTSGGITSPLPEFANTGVGFYINATSNKEANASQSLWKRNNLYVQHNKIYYRAGSSGSSAREKTRGVDFVPVIFDDEGGEDPDIKDNSDRIVGDGCVYDLQGRKVATKQQVEDDTWRQFLRPGIYIINGKKIRL